MYFYAKLASELRYHGTWWYALWLILKCGILLESKNEAAGHVPSPFRRDPHCTVLCNNWHLFAWQCKLARLFMFCVTGRCVDAMCFGFCVEATHFGSRVSTAPVLDTAKGYARPQPVFHRHGDRGHPYYDRVVIVVKHAGNLDGLLPKVLQVCH